jgi:hypothetical protein
MKKEEGGFKFNEKAHRYTLDGKPLTGVTTVLSIISKPALIQWAANMAVGYIEERFKNIIFPSKETDGIEHVDCSYKELFELLKEAKTAHRRKKEEAADTGTLAHKWIEDWINGKNPPSDPLIDHMTCNFVKWAEENEVEFIEAEKKVYSRVHWYAGTLDFLCKINGRTYLGDLKTSSGIYDDYFFQTSAYQLALQELEPDLKIDGHVIINCTKEGKFNKKFSFDYEKNIPVFLGALTIYRRKGELEKANPWKKKRK